MNDELNYLHAPVFKWPCLLEGAADRRRRQLWRRFFKSGKDLPRAFDEALGRERGPGESASRAPARRPAPSARLKRTRTCDSHSSFEKT